jgi:hypothetical protein
MRRSDDKGAKDGTIMLVHNFSKTGSFIPYSGILRLAKRAEGSLNRSDGHTS